MILISMISFVLIESYFNTAIERPSFNQYKTWAALKSLKIKCTFAALKLAVYDSNKKYSNYRPR